MKCNLKKTVVVSLLSTVFLIAAAMFLLSGAAIAPEGQAQEAGYSGSKACVEECHDDLYPDFSTSVHARRDKATKEISYIAECEDCHGPGQEHIDKEGLELTKYSLPFTSDAFQGELCLKGCHQKAEGHFRFRMAEHNLSSVSCISCHKVHEAKEKQMLLAEKDPGLCFSCHREVRAEFAKTERHPVTEGAMSCIDCHDQHGSVNKGQLRKAALGNETCNKCHAEKRGPFVFEHLSSFVEGCTACHTPHGSEKRHMLTRQTVRFLCLECHTVQPSFHNQAVARYQTCTNCHFTIHGSNTSNVFLR